MPLYRPTTSSTTLAYATKTGNYTLTSSDDIIGADSSGGTFTLTLPSAAGITKPLVVKKIDSSFTVVSIATTSSQTMDGITGRQLSTQWESYTFVSDGSNWLVRDHQINSIPTAATSISTDNLGTTTTINVYYHREGNFLIYRGYFKVGTTAGGAAAITLPNSLTIDTNYIGTTAGSGLVGTTGNLPSGANQALSSTDKNPVLFFDGSTTTKVFFAYQGGSAAFQKVNGNTLWTSGDGISFWFKVPITNWNG